MLPPLKIVVFISRVVGHTPTVERSLTKSRNHQSAVIDFKILLILEKQVPAHGHPLQSILYRNVTLFLAEHKYQGKFNHQLSARSTRKQVYIQKPSGPLTARDRVSLLRFSWLHIMCFPFFRGYFTKSLPTPSVATLMPTSTSWDHHAAFNEGSRWFLTKMMQFDMCIAIGALGIATALQHFGANNNKACTLVLMTLEQNIGILKHSCLCFRWLSCGYWSPSHVLSYLPTASWRCVPPFLCDRQSPQHSLENVPNHLGAW